MSGSRARRVRRNKALKAMYCPNDAFLGPLPTVEFLLRSYWAKAVRDMRKAFTPVLAQLSCIKPYSGKPITFPLDLS